MAQATTPVDLFNMTKHFANEGLRCLNRIQLQPPDLSSSNEVDIAPNSPTNDFLAISAAVPPNFPQERIPFLQRIIDYNNSIINSKSQGKRREWHLTEEELTFIESHYTGGREEAEEGAKVSMPWSRVIFPEGQKRGFFRHCRSAMDVSRAYWALRVHVPKRRKRF
ncbi:hypothetical protein BDF20DRAFT_698725 [Mycotypha africana]|uniref:uncharacterized protein n=1 Tax=Mycotypha africana TaxID=64632 RepID=UPI002300A2E8|nr:uncharacterized protein BDF20DRAFT_698725 [Mycotypha africana]KAI8971787.1 hypothetical protein BDF20DRAFT_698725 [Mycotypha africana]